MTRRTSTEWATCDGADDGADDGGRVALAASPWQEPRSRLAGRLARWFESWALAVWLCRAAWWPLVRWARRRPEGSSVRRALAAAARVAPWAFRAASLPERWDGWGREAARGFGGSTGEWCACDGRPRLPVGLTHGARPPPQVFVRRRRCDQHGRAVGWRMVAR